MRFGLFYEHQLPRPHPEGAEEQRLSDALAQALVFRGMQRAFVPEAAVGVRGTIQDPRRPAAEATVDRLLAG